ncbi:putative 26s proteasome regulatory complex subunit, partial [Toxoplasma gondii ARI]
MVPAPEQTGSQSPAASPATNGDAGKAKETET